MLLPNTQEFKGGFKDVKELHEKQDKYLSVFILYKKKLLFKFE